jgi:hypothetical protein
MAGMMENLSTLNSFLRTLIALVVIGAVSALGYFGYNKYNANGIEAESRARQLKEAEARLTQVKQDLEAASFEIQQKEAKIQEQVAAISKLNKEVEKLETSLALLKVDHRVARLSVVDQDADATKVQFVELNDEGQPIETPREFRIPGNTVYIDAWVVKFDDKYVQEADLERGTSLILFKRLFGNDQKPDEGFPLDEQGVAPKAYARGGKMNDFEKAIFSDFWSLANDKAKAEAKGIRAAHGDAVSMKVEKGKTYKVQLRASDGPSIVPE